MRTGKDHTGGQKRIGLISRMIGALSRYVDSPDPLTRANNVLALMVASNQPFYPFYVRFIAGDDNGVTFLTLLSTPLFLAIPFLSRARPAMALAGIPVIGLVNGMIAMKALGADAGFELFVIPCLLVALLLSHKNSWKTVTASALFAAFAFSLQFFLQRNSLHQFDVQQYDNLYRLNAFSVAGLTVFIAFSLGRARYAFTRSRT